MADTLQSILGAVVFVLLAVILGLAVLTGMARGIGWLLDLFYNL